MVQPGRVGASDRVRALMAARARERDRDRMIRSGATPKRSHPMVCRRWMGGGTLHRRRRDALRACWPGTLPRLVTLGDSELVPLLKAARSSGRSSGQM